MSFTNLPTELVERIAKDVHVQNTLALRQVCKQLRTQLPENPALVPRLEKLFTFMQRFVAETKQTHQRVEFRTFNWLQDIEAEISADGTISTSVSHDSCQGSDYPWRHMFVKSRLQSAEAARLFARFSGQIRTVEFVAWSFTLRYDAPDFQLRHGEQLAGTPSGSEKERCLDRVTRLLTYLASCRHDDESIQLDLTDGTKQYLNCEVYRSVKHSVEERLRGVAHLDIRAITLRKSQYNEFGPPFAPVLKYEGPGWTLVDEDLLA